MRLIYEPEQLDAMRTMLREFYQVLKDEGAYLKFVFHYRCDEILPIEHFLLS